LRCESLRATARAEIPHLSDPKRLFDSKNIESLRIEGRSLGNDGGMELRLWHPLMASGDLGFGEGGVQETRRWGRREAFRLEAGANRSIPLDRLVFSTPVPYVLVWVGWTSIHGPLWLYFVYKTKKNQKFQLLLIELVPGLGPLTCQGPVRAHRLPGLWAAPVTWVLCHRTLRVSVFRYNRLFPLDVICR
jgi:hypothetical protein